MSEYQYYEFRTVDRPLTRTEMQELRDISTRAEITPYKFTNHYEWGDFKGNPLELMRKYFDAHVYVANWCTAILKLRIPLVEQRFSAYSAPNVLDFDETNSHCIISWSLLDSDDYDRFAVEEGSEWLDRLLPIRDELLRGDLRSLYLGWLGGISQGVIEDDELEPVPPPGLMELTQAQEALAEFIEVDKALLRAAAKGSPKLDDVSASRKELDAWLKTVPRKVADEILVYLLQNQSVHAERRVRDLYYRWQSGNVKAEPERPRRTVGQICDSAYPDS